MAEERYKGKMMSAAEAAKLVKSGDRVYVGTASSFAYDMLEALWDRKDLSFKERLYLIKERIKGN